MTADGDAHATALDRAVGDARARAERIRECVDAMRGAVGTGSAGGGRVQASVDGFGTPTRLHVGPELLTSAQEGTRTRAQRIGELVVEACAAAADDLARRHGGIVASMLPGAAEDLVPGDGPRAPGNDENGAAAAAHDDRGGNAIWH